MPKSQLLALQVFAGPTLWVALLFTLGGSAVAVSDYFGALSANQTILSLQARHDTVIDASLAAPQVILARLNQLINAERLDDAQSLLNSVETKLPPAERIAALYNVANARTRQAADLVQKGDVDSATAVTNLAKSEYRLALKVNPEDWDVKYNLDVAMRVVRDLPEAVNPTNKTLKTPKQIWYELPGVPKGEP